MIDGHRIRFKVQPAILLLAQLLGKELRIIIHIEVHGSKHSAKEYAHAPTIHNLVIIGSSGFIFCKYILFIIVAV